jgi:hypothetical protein
MADLAAKPEPSSRRNSVAAPVPASMIRSARKEDGSRPTTTPRNSAAVTDLGKILLMQILLLKAVEI